MIKSFEISKQAPSKCCDDLLRAWSEPETKVVVCTPSEEFEDVKAYYESLFPYLGRPMNLAEDASISDRNKQRTGAIWMEIRYDPKIKDAYRHSSEAQPLHTDGSYIPGFPNSSLLCCVKNAGLGGETVFIDTTDLMNALENEEPELLDFLLTHDIPHSRSGDRRTEKVLYQKDGRWHVNWNYYCVADDLAADARQQVEKFHEYLKTSSKIKSYLQEVKLEPGQAVMWKDNEVLHGRNAFSASEESERFIWKCAFDVGNFE